MGHSGVAEIRYSNWELTEWYESERFKDVLLNKLGILLFRAGLFFCREYKIDVFDNAFKPQILLIEEGDRVWWEWSKGKVRRPPLSLRDQNHCSDDCLLCVLLISTGRIVCIVFAIFSVVSHLAILFMIILDSTEKIYYKDWSLNAWFISIVRVEIKFLEIFITYPVSWKSKPSSSFLWPSRVSYKSNIFTLQYMVTYQYRSKKTSVLRQLLSMFPQLF